MDAEHKDEEAIFKAAFKLKSPTERIAHLKRACGNDADLLARVEALLKAYNEAGNFLESPPGVDGTLDAGPLAEGPGTKIGRYKLLQLIGEGGFGVVYMAEQREPIRRKVALKIIKLGMDTKQVIARFEAERQALAMMEHPNIAKVLDAGATDTGRPYFVMELVRGIPITEYCDKNNLPTRRRLELFIDVCRAVQHAHQKGIIHRDIKPTNVMITLRDNGTGVPKIIDFGIAKATQQRLTEKTLFTEYHQFIGTPEYMSPEQAQMGDADVDTRSDVYSLGVLLYELLTGTTPFGHKELVSTSYDEMRRMIRETDPPKPSTRLNTLGDALSEVAKHRDAQPAELFKIIRGDLDWVVMKTLEKDRTRRYETANELAMDIERHLRDEAVVAGRPGTTYRVRKFVRRNRTGVVFALSVTAVLLIGLSLAIAGFVQASHERNRAQANFQEARDAVDEMTQVAEKQLVNVPGTEKVRGELLQKAQIFYQRFVQEEISNDPGVRQEMGRAYKRLADIHQMLGEFKQAEQAFGEAIAIFEALSGEFPTVHEYRRDLAGALFWLGVLLKNYIYDVEEALKVYRRSFELRAQLVDEFPSVPEYLGELAHSHVDLGLVLRDLGRREEALGEFRQGLDLRAQLASRFPDVVEYRSALAHSHHWLGACLQGVGQLEEAEKHLRECLVLREKLAEELPDSAKDQHDLAHIENYLGRLLVRRGQSEEAVEILEDAAAIGEELVGGFPKFHGYWWRVSRSYEALAEALADTGRGGEAEEKLRQCLSARQRLVSDVRGNRMYEASLYDAHHELGLFLQATNRLGEAEQAYLDAIELLEQMVADFPEVPECREKLGEIYRDLGDVLEKMGRVDEAQEAYQKARKLEEEVVPEETGDG
jgi:serine/threonine protein kinase/tetratricopeptide (TPR) repeat protein